MKGNFVTKILIKLEESISRVPGVWLRYSRAWQQTLILIHFEIFLLEWDERKEAFKNGE